MTVPSTASLLFSLPITFSAYRADLPTRRLASLGPVFALPGPYTFLCPHSSDYTRCWNLHQLSIAYDFRPELRSRLTQGRSALPWNPWIFGHDDSHIILATHSGILSSCHSTAPYRYSFDAAGLLLYHSQMEVLSFGVVFQPRKFSAQDLSTSELLRTL